LGFPKQEDAVLAKTLAVCAALLLTSPLLAAEDDKGKEKKAKKPALDLRSSPRFAFSPARILFTAELKGGDDVEEMYCPEVEWEWGDGGRSVEEADCDPWVPGATAIERRFTADHVFQFAGRYAVRVALRKSGRLIAQQTLMMSIRAGLGDTQGVDPGLN
jgi:hypothetical protein